jgi:hypothetical protein
MVALLDVELLFKPQSIDHGIALGEAAVGDQN